MRRLLIALIALVIPVAAATLAAQDTGALAPLQGRWMVTGGEHDSKPMDAIKGGVMTINGNAFEVRTASGNVLKGTLRVDTAKNPSQMDLLHADGTRWEAIYAVEGETFRLNYIETGAKDVRPSAFTTGNGTEASIVTMQREKR